MTNAKKILEGRREAAEQARIFASLTQQVLNNEAYKAIILKRKAALFETFCGTSADEQDVREEAWRTMQNLKALEQDFAEAINNGIIADDQLKEIDLHNKSVN